MMMVMTDITAEELLSPEGQKPAAARDSWGRKCLVVSGDGVFRSRAEAAADLSGCAVCSTPTDLPALAKAVEGDFDVVVVDIARPLGERVSGAVEIAEEFANRGSNLFVFCGSEAGLDEELWARQIGAWVYRPGEWPLTLGGVA